VFHINIYSEMVGEELKEKFFLIPHFSVAGELAGTRVEADGGLAVSMLASGSRVRGFKPG
jgi:hypothetical protein